MLSPDASVTKSGDPREMSLPLGRAERFCSRHSRDGLVADEISSDAEISSVRKINCD
jgi:hypothetical protein